MNKKVSSLELEGENRFIRVERLLIGVEPPLRQVQKVVFEMVSFQSFYKATLIAILKFSFGVVMWKGDDSRKELNRPRMHFDKEDTVVEPVRISGDKEMYVWECWRGKKNLERDIRVHDYAVGIEPPGKHVS